MIGWVCDRCGKITPFDMQDPDKFKQICYGTTDIHDNFEGITADLCDSCYEQLLEWLQNY